MLDDGDHDRQGSHAAAVTDDEATEKADSGKPISDSWRDEPLTLAESLKVTQVLQACSDNDREQLIALATTPGGFVEDHVRRIACKSFSSPLRGSVANTDFRANTPWGPRQQ